MARLPTFKRIVIDRLARYKDLQEPLFNVLNSFMENVNRALNKRLTFGDNFDGEVLTITDDGQYPHLVAWGRSQRPQALWIGQIARVDGDALNLPVAVSLEWAFNQNRQIEITNIIGLGASNSDQYRLTLIGVTG